MASQNTWGKAQVLQHPIQAQPACCPLPPPCLHLLLPCTWSWYLLWGFMLAASSSRILSPLNLYLFCFFPKLPYIKVLFSRPSDSFLYNSLFTPCSFILNPLSFIFMASLVIWTTQQFLYGWINSPPQKCRCNDVENTFNLFLSLGQYQVPNINFLSLKHKWENK